MISFHLVGFKKNVTQVKPKSVISLWLGVVVERTPNNGIAMAAKVTTKPVDYGYY